jgi:hypothetical protein
MAGVPRGNRCQGHSDAEKAAASSGSIFGRIFGR